MPSASGDKIKSRTPILAAILIACAVLAAYSGSFGGPFIYDDLGSIPGNPSIRHLWPAWGALSPPLGEGRTVEGRPVLNLSLALNYAISGTAVWSYHVANLLIHLLAGLTLFGIARRTLARLRPVPGASLAIVLLWTLHPLQTEAVTYTIQRAESLMGLFYLLTLYGFVRYAEDGKSMWAWLSVACCLLGMGTKEVAVTLPVLVFLYDRTFVAGSFREAWVRRRRYHLGLAACWVLLIFLVVSGGGNRSGSVGFGAGLSWAAYTLTQFKAIVRYLALAFWPHPLVFDYGPFLLRPAEAAPYALVVVVLAAGTVWSLIRLPIVGFLGFWFFGILAVTSLTPGTSEMIVERRMYLPLAAVVALVVAGLFRWAGRRAIVICLFLAAGLGCLTWRRNLAYRSDLAIWSDSVAKVPNNSRAQYNLGVAYFNRGQADQEIARYEEALRLDPNNEEAHHSLANALLRQGLPAEAITHFKAALALKPQAARTHYDYGVFLQQTGDLDRAFAEYEEALRLDPLQAEAQDNLGVALAARGHLPEAIAHFREALRIDPRLLRARVNLGGALAEQDHLPESVSQFEEALRIDPEFVGARINLANVLSREGRFADAIPHYERALRAQPGDSVLHRNLGVAMTRVGRNEDAQAPFELAARSEGSGH